MSRYDSHQSANSMRPHWPTAHRSSRSVIERLFVGLHLDPRSARIAGALVRIWGSGYDAVGDVLASAHLYDERVAKAINNEHADHETAIEVAEATAPVINSLITESKADQEHLRAACVLGLGRWDTSPLNELRFSGRCDTHLLAAQSGLTIIDGLVPADQACGGRGGPLEATGAWLLWGDRGLVPGRVIRAMLELGPTARLVLFPPRQSDQLPNHLVAFDIVPAQDLLDGIVAFAHRFDPNEQGHRFDPQELLAVQSKQIPEILAAWNKTMPLHSERWSPNGIDVQPLLTVLYDWHDPLSHRIGDLLCTAIHWIAERIGRFVSQDLPPSQPIGQLLLAGDLRRHSFLRQQLTEHIPAVSTRLADEVNEVESWRAVASAMLGMLCVDQVPANSAALTGTQSPRVLGRITPGIPSNWHRVLDDLALTLPDKRTLRSAV